jgi:hypothetical protein
MRIKTLLILIVFIGAITQLSAQQETHDYEITLAGFTIGEMQATKSQLGDTTLFRLRSEVSFWLFGRIHVDYTTEVKYLGQKFISSRVESNSNRGNFLSTVDWDGNYYHIHANSYKYEHKERLSETITYSAVRLFFEEPKGISKMMAENYGKFASVTPMGDGQYHTLVAGNKNRYWYENGKMQRVSMQSPVKNYIIQRKE